MNKNHNCVGFDCNIIVFLGVGGGGWGMDWFDNAYWFLLNGSALFVCGMMSGGEKQTIFGKHYSFVPVICEANMHVFPQ